jgi:hypothetical protein
MRYLHRTKLKLPCVCMPNNRLSRVIPSALVLAALAIVAGLPTLAQTPAATTTTLAITSGGSAVTTVASGAAVKLTATVLWGTTPVTPGLVKFCDASASYCEDFHLLGTAQLTSAGRATAVIRPTPGSHSY